VGPLTLAAGQSIALGSIGNFSTAAAQAGLGLKFILGNEEIFRFGAVSFTTGQAGDFDGDGRVDGRDFLVWQRGGSPSPLSSGDLAAWRSNFGAGGAAAVAAAVPGPTALALGLVVSVAFAIRRRTERTSVTNSSQAFAGDMTRSPSGQRTMKNQLLLLVIVLLFGVRPAMAAAPVMGLKFAADDPDAATSTLDPAEIAGVYPQPNWNNLNGPTGTGVGGLSYRTSAGSVVASAATVTWSSPNTWRSTTGNNAFPEGPNRKLVAGYLDTNDTAAATGIASITVTGIEATLRTPKYDVFVYFVSDSGENRGGGYTIYDGSGPITKYGSTMAMPTDFVEDPGTDIDNSIDGTYLRFTGLTGPDITLTGNATLTTPNGFRAPINAIQIVAWSGDADGDGDADINDYQVIRANLEKPAAGRFQGADLTGDAFVDLNDFRRWANVAPPAVVASVSIPEPSAMGLAAVSVFAGAWIRRRVKARGQQRVRSGATLKPTLVLALVAAACATSTASAQTPILGLKFAADDPDAATSSLAPTDIAGVVPTVNWNNLTGATGTDVGGLVYNSGGAAVPSSATVTWASNNTWRSTTGNNAFPEGPNRKLMAGYLDTLDTTAGGITITVTGLDAAIRAPAYDVYVYFLGDSGANRGGGYTLNDGLRTELKYGSTMAMPTAFVEDPGTDADNSIDGNYLRFRGFIGSSFTLTSDTTLTTPNGTRAPINAIEIVGAQSFAPGPGDVNEDGATNLADYNIIKANFFQTTGTSRITGDLNIDGRIDLADYRLWRNNAPLSEVAGLGIPEPGTSVLIGAAWVALAGMTRRLRRR
jgi:hypothetical protein